MSLAVEDLIAQAVADEMNLASQAWAPLPNPVVPAYYNVFTTDDMNTLRVVTVPLTLAYTHLDRAGAGQYDYGITIYLGKKVNSGTLEEITLLNALAQSIHDAYRKPRKITGTNYGVLFATRPEIMNAEMLWDQRTWETYIELAVRNIR